MIEQQLIAKIDALKPALRYTLILNAEIPDYDNLTFGDIVEDPTDHIENMEKLIWLEQLQREMETSLSKLPDRQIEIIRKRFYLGQSLQEIAKGENVGTESIRQQESRALRFLRHPGKAYSLWKLVGYIT